MGAIGTGFQTRSSRLMAMANELATLAKQIEQEDNAGHSRLIGQSIEAIEPHAPALGDPGTAQADHPHWADIAREHYRSRRRRDKIFRNQTLFGEPAWDILLDLFIAAKEGRRVSVMSACIGAAVPSTTALRWITALEKEGLLLREDDPVDARRTFVQLSPSGYAAMVEYFAAAVKPAKTSTFARIDDFDRLMEASHCSPDPGSYIEAPRKLG